MDESYTVSEIADHIQRPNESLAATVDRIRNWTDEGLLVPLGKRNPGTGRHRRYPVDIIEKAEILEMLCNLGVPVTGAVQRKLVRKVLVEHRLFSALQTLTSAIDE